MAYTVNKGIIKIPTAGDFFTMVVKKCEVVDSKFQNDDGSFKEEVKFTDPSGDALFIPRKTADFQLGNWCGFGEKNPDGSWNIGYGDVDGHALTFRRDPNPKMPTKPYYGIRRADESGDVNSRPSLAAAGRAAAEAVRKAQNLPRDPEDAPSGPAKGSPRPEPSPDGAKAVDALDRAYRHAYEVAKAVQGKGATADSLQAGAATLVIQYDRHNLTALFAAPAKPEPAADDGDPGPEEPGDDDGSLPF